MREGAYLSHYLILSPLPFVLPIALFVFTFLFDIFVMGFTVVNVGIREHVV